MNSFLIPLGLAIVFLAALTLFFFNRTKGLERTLVEQRNQENLNTKTETKDINREVTAINQNQIPIYKTLTEADLPKDLDLKEVKILQTNIIQNGNPITIKEPIVTVGGSGEKITINLVTKAFKNENEN